MGGGDADVLWNIKVYLKYKGRTVFFLLMDTTFESTKLGKRLHIYTESYQSVLVKWCLHCSLIDLVLLRAH